MVYVPPQRWMILVCVQLLMKIASTQMPLYQQVMHMPVPMPVHVAVPVPIAVEASSTTSTTTTTTTESSRAIAYAVPVPVPMPMPVQVAVPAPPPPVFCQGSSRPKGCPPCPPCVCTPSCTPAFFSYCSPCHQKCRCRDASNAPVPQPPYPPQPVPGPAFPMPVPGPAFSMPVPVPQPPVLMLPFPPIRRLPMPGPRDRSDRRDRIRRRPRYRPSSGTCDSESDSGSIGSSSDTGSSTDWDLRTGKRPRRGRSGRRSSLKARRIMPRGYFSDGDFAKPELTFVADNGDIKIKRKISSAEAADLLNGNAVVDGRGSHIYQIQTGNQNGGLLVSEHSNKKVKGRKKIRKTQVALRKGETSHVLGSGKKELFFKPPNNKKISNLSVSFHVE